MIATSTDAKKLTVDKEFEALCPKLTNEEFNLLEVQIEADGCRDPIIVWANHDDTIIDGHNRYRICKDNKLPFQTRALAFADRDEVIIWITKNQLGRRNLSEEQKSYLRGKRLEATKRQKGGQDGNANAKKNESATVAQSNSRKSTAAKIAEEEGVSERTVNNDAAFAKAVDTLAENVGEEAREAVMTKAIPRKEAVAIAKLPKEEQPAAVKRAAEKPAKEAGKSKAYESVWEDAHKHLDKVREAMDRASSMHTKLAASVQYKNFLDGIQKVHRLIDSLERKSKT